MVVKYHMFRSSLGWLYMLGWLYDGCMMVVYGCKVPYSQIQSGMVVYVHNLNAYLVRTRQL